MDAVSTDSAASWVAGSEGFFLFLQGDWSFEHLNFLDRCLTSVVFPEGAPSLSAAYPVVQITLDGEMLSKLDTAAAFLLVRYLHNLNVDLSKIELKGFHEKHARLFALVLGKSESESLILTGNDHFVSSHSFWNKTLEFLGDSVVGVLWLLNIHLYYVGKVIFASWRLLKNPKLLRGRELSAQLFHVGICALPVVMLTMTLIGLVVTYLLGLQATRYGANLFVVDGVVMGIVREFSPMLVAVVVAGRSGSAFTAQLATMHMTGEMDAIRMIGLSIEQVLILPRIFALMIFMPLLIFVGDVVGIFSAAFVSNAMLDISPWIFFERVSTSFLLQHFFIGLIKGPVFAFFLGVIACGMGMESDKDTQSLGSSTTSTVVQAIVSVILLDALFALFLSQVHF